MGSTARNQPRPGCRGFRRTGCNFATWRVFGGGAQADAEAAERCADRAQSWMTVCCVGLGMRVRWADAAGLCGYDYNLVVVMSVVGKLPWLNPEPSRNRPARLRHPMGQSSPR